MPSLAISTHSAAATPCEARARTTASWLTPGEVAITAEIQRCLGRSNIIECAAGDRVLKAGGAGRNIFVVLAGTLEVRVDDRPVGVLQTGDAFGETAFLLDMTRTADIVAVVPDSRILSLSDGALRKMIEEEPTIAAKFLLNLSKMLCGRLIKAN